MGSTIQQPIIRGIQAVGSVEILYRYNGNGGTMTLPDTIQLGTGAGAVIDTSAGVPVSGFRLDSEFLRANPQIASSFVIPILGGGGIALTNNNRTGTLNLSCTKVSTPNPGTNKQQSSPAPAVGSLKTGAMFTPTGNAIGVYGADKNVYDMVFLAQVQQAQVGGDSEGATITVNFMFCGLKTSMQFQGCTIASVDPIGLSGNDAVNYNVAINYLNWVVQYDASDGTNTPANGSAYASAGAGA